MKFNPVPKSSFKYMKRRVKNSSKMRFFTHLLQINVVDMAIIYNLDSERPWALEKDNSFNQKKPKQDYPWDEIDLLTSIDSFVGHKTYINTGFNYNLSSSNWTDDDERTDIELNVHTNETNSLCFTT